MLTLICGMPRAGKTTMSEKYNCEVVHLDYIGVDRCLKKAKTDNDIVLEGVFGNTNVRHKICENYLGNEKVCIWLDTPLEVRKKRTGWSKFCECVIFNPPTLEEGWDKIIIIREDNVTEICK